jgi:Stage II sporulation protein E (SpoIIE)
VPSSAPTVVATTTPVATTSPARVEGAAGTGAPARTHHGGRPTARAHRHSVRHRTVRRASADHAVSSPRTLAAVAGTGTKAARRTEARKTHSNGARAHPPTHARTSPLVTTITKIAEVVPLPVKLLLGLLLSLSLALGTRSWLGALGARRLERQRSELLEDVGLLQAALLPQPPERLGAVGTSAAYRPADGPGAGGDFYDVFALGDDRVAVILGDISGHGRQALPHTALVRFTLRAYLEAGLSPRVAVQTAESVLERQLGESFATVVVATYDPHERTLVYACAGHPPPLVVGSWSMESTESTRLVGSAQSRGSTGLVGSAGSIGSVMPITVCAAPPIGAGMRTGSRQTTVAVPGEARVCFYTDGVTEARTGGELFGARRLTRALAGLGPAASASQLLEQVAQTTDTRSDDMAACVLNIAGEAHAAPEVLLEELELDRESPSAERAEQLLLACGVPRQEIPELIRSARLAAGQAGSAILELHPAEDGPPHVQLRRDNVARLPTALARGEAAVGGAML